MKNRLAPMRIPMILAIMTLAASTLACLTGSDLLDQVIFPDEYEQHEKLMREPWQSQDITRHLLPVEPQGEFVAPVAPAAPQGQSAVPQANPPPAAALPGAPVILSTHFPSPIPADGQWHYGWIDFTDSGGDVTTLKIEILWTTAPVKGPGATRDAEIEGQPTAGKVRMRFT